MIRKNWHTYPILPPRLRAQYRDVNPVVAQVLHNRGFTDPDDAVRFLYGNEYNTDPFIMKDMEKAVERITSAIKADEKIAVYGDFDADGVTATTLMMHVLRRLKANAIAYIPDRVDEGYGLNSPALEKLADEGVTLVITVDCGIRSVQEVEDAKSYGLDMIITDHHSLGPELPDAYAIINPQQPDCGGDSRIAGVGVAFMVARGLLLDAWERNGRASTELYRSLLDELLDLVAIGTIADIMPLNTPLNRSLVRHGLNRINAAPRPGLRVLLAESGVRLSDVDAMTIGFVIGPRINAAGRLAHAKTAYRLLSAETNEEAVQFAQQLNHLNDERQRLTRKFQARINHHIAETGQEDDDLIFASDPEIPQGIVGLVAGRLTEEYYRPTVVLERGETESHASCRSIPEFHITNALDECADLLLRHGGHAMAAGFTVANENIPQVREHLKQSARDALRALDLAPTIYIDQWLDFDMVSQKLVNELNILEPTGHDNPRPVFATKQLRVRDSRTVGSDNSHLKLKLAADGRAPVDAIAFRMGHMAADLGDTVDVAYRLEINEWQRRINVQLNVVDIRPTGVEA